MTAPEIPPPKDRWLRAIGYGLLAEVATIFTIVAVVLIYRYAIARGLTDDQYVAFAQRTGAILGVIGGTLYVYLFAHLLMRRLTTRFVAHGIVVAIWPGRSRRDVHTSPASVASQRQAQKRADGCPWALCISVPNDQSTIVSETGSSR